MDKTYSIYAFKDNGAIVYIGMTCNTQKRFRQHIIRSNRRSTAKDKWIKEQAANGTFAPHILFSNLSEEEAHIKERNLLHKYNPIFNVITYNLKPKNNQRAQNFEQWFTPYIHEFVRNYINTP